MPNPRRLVGRGAFSKVYEDSDTVAVKVIDIDDQIAPHSYKSEIAALDALRDTKGVIQLIRSEIVHTPEHEARLYMHLYKYTLLDLVHEFRKAKWPPNSGWRNAFPIERALSIVSTLANCLASIHAKGIIHRDLKAENVFFNSIQGPPVLGDFGIAWLPGKGESPKVCDVSTGEYKAPELLFGRAYDTKIDVWALGCILGLLLSHNAESVFGEYTSEICLLGAQLELLDHSNCSSYENLPHIPMSRSMNLRGHEELVRRLLTYEPTLRPSSKEVCLLLSAV